MAPEGEASPKIVVNKWLTFSACALIQLSAGLSYAFGLFSPAIKQQLGWSQVQLTAFGTCLNLGSFAAVIPGLMLDFFGDGLLGPKV